MSKLRTFTKEFKVFGVSSNTNSFGLTGVIIVAKDGETWEGGVSQLHVPKKGDTIKLVYTEVAQGQLAKYPQFPSGWEIPERHKDAPAVVLQQLFGS